MTNIEYRKYKAHIYNHMDPEDLKANIEQYRTLRESNGTVWGAAQTMVQWGCFDCYFSQVLDTLKYVYGDDYDESKYLTKKGELRYKNGECYCWTIYKAKIARTIEIMLRKGEI